MGRLLAWVVFWVLAPVAALAGGQEPAEPPPPDFPSRQYVDSRGCVFLRDEAGLWQPRLDRAGAPVCGYQPSLAARIRPGRPRLRALDPDQGHTRAEMIEQALTRQVITNLHQGELTGDPHPFQPLPDMGPEPAPTGPLDDLRAAVRAAPAVRQAMARDLHPNRRLCRLLGHDDRPPPAGAIGGDPTQGFCGALPASTLAHLAFARPAGSPPAAGVREEGKVDSAMPARDDAAVPPPRLPPPPLPPRAGPAAVPSVSPSPARGRAALSDRGKARPRATPARPAGGREGTGAGGPAGHGDRDLIPPGARHVRIGSFASPRDAGRAARRAGAMGYPVIRRHVTAPSGGAAVEVLVGPFATREEIVRALDRMRRAGWGDARAR